MKVLVAIDGSAHSEAAVAEVARRPWQAGTEVEILTVIHPIGPMLPDPAFVMAAIHMEQATELRHVPVRPLSGNRTLEADDYRPSRERPRCSTTTAQTEPVDPRRTADDPADLWPCVNDFQSSTGGVRFA
jgi:hypothetical protein